MALLAWPWLLVLSLTCGFDQEWNICASGELPLSLFKSPWQQLKPTCHERFVRAKQRAEEGRRPILMGIGEVDWQITQGWQKRAFR